MCKRANQVVVAIGVSTCVLVACARPSPEGPQPGGGDDGAPPVPSAGARDAGGDATAGAGGPEEETSMARPDADEAGGAPEPAPRGQGEVVVEVTGMRNDDGQVLVALFRSADGFPDDRDRAEASAATRIRGGRARHAFSPVPPGPFAVAVLHDENENFKMDTNFLGIPREGYGASRNPAPRLGPPRYDDAELSLQPGQRAVVRIEVVYP